VKPGCDGKTSWRCARIKRKVLIVLSHDGRRLLVDAIARHEILRRAPHAIVSGTLARDEA